MRTTDFSCTPPMGQANALFVGGTRFSGPWSLVQLYRGWVPLVRRMKRAPGYCGHYVWYRFPFTLGTIAFFADRDALLAFARTPEHVALMRWVMRPGSAHGGFIRLHEARPQGYSSGIWRAEEHVMRTIAQFSPLTTETVGPAAPRD